MSERITLKELTWATPDSQALHAALVALGGSATMDQLCTALDWPYKQAQDAAIRLHRMGYIDYPGTRVG